MQEIEEWVREADCGRVMCYSCRHFSRDGDHDHNALVCRGCPVAWRRSGNEKAKYYREPVFGCGLPEEI